MTDVIPRAGFPDPLLQQRAGRRIAQFKTLIRSAASVIGIVVFAVAALAIAVSEETLDLFPLAVFAIGSIIVAVIAFVVADRRARAEWWLALLDHLDLQPSLDDGVEGLTPLLRSGDEREVLSAGRDEQRELLVFRSTDVSRDSKGNRQESHHDYTVVLYRRDPAALRFLSAHEHRLAALKFLGDDLRGRTARDVEEFTVESVELGERFALRSSEEDAAKARGVFTPSFMVWFARHGVPFEYESGDLVVFTDRVIEHAEEMKVLLDRAAQIDAAIRGTWDPSP